MNTKGVLFYDGTCPFCVKWIERVRPHLIRKGVSTEPFEDGKNEAEMKLAWHDGRNFGGADAAFFLARRFFLFFPVGVAGSIPVIRELGRAVYRRIASQRHCLGNGACEINLRLEESTEDPSKKRAVLAGGSGFLGQALAKRLVEQDWDVVLLTRSPANYKGEGKPVYWDGKTFETSWADFLEGADALVNLAGKNVNCRPTRANRELVMSSRIDSVRVLGDALRKTYRPPKVWVQASSLAIYGDAGNRVCDESGFVPDSGYPVDVCVAWEEELGRAVRPGMRWSLLRIGFVLGKNGGALPFLASLARFGLGGKIGNGRQWISWIHLEDMLRIFLEAIGSDKIEGVVNATGLQPVTNAEFMSALRRAVRRPFGFSAPGWAVRIGAWILNSDPEIALTGRRCLPLRIHRTGFQFEFQELENALKNILVSDQPIKKTKPKICATQPCWVAGTTGLGQ